MASQAGANSLGNLAAAAVLVLVGFIAGRMTGDEATPEAKERASIASPAKGRRAVIQFEVGQEPRLLRPERGSSSSEWRVFKLTQAAYLKSPFVLQAALGMDDGKVSRVSPLKGIEDKVAWLQKHLVVAFPDNGEIMEVALKHPQAPKENLRDLVGAIGKAYYDEVVFREEQRRRLPLQLMKMSSAKLQKVIGEKREDYAERYQEAADAAAADSDLIALKLDIDNQQAVLDQLTRRIATEEVEIQMPKRIRAIGSGPDGAPIAAFYGAE